MFSRAYSGVFPRVPPPKGFSELVDATSSDEELKALLNSTQRKIAMLKSDIATLQILCRRVEWILNDRATGAAASPTPRSAEGR